MRTGLPEHHGQRAEEVPVGRIPGRGFWLGEKLVVLAIAAVVTGAGMSLLAVSENACESGQPMVRQPRLLASALAEVRLRAAMTVVAPGGGGDGGGK